MLQIDIVQRGRNATTFWSVKFKQLFWENKTSYQIFRIIVRAGRIGLMKAGGGDYLQPNFNEPICSHLNDAERNKKINKWKMNKNKWTSTCLFQGRTTLIVQKWKIS